MQQVLRQSKNLDPEAARWFEVIDRFDSALASNASAEALVRLAAEITGRPTGIRDDWNGLDVGAFGGSLVAAETLSGHEVTRGVFSARVRGRNAVLIDLSEGSAVAVSVEVGAGRVGVAWTLGQKRTRWRALDYLVTERLASAVGAQALAERTRVAAEHAGDPAAVEKLLGGGISRDDLARVARHAKLVLDGTFVAIAVEQSPPNAVSLETLGSIVARALAERGAVVRVGVVGRMAGLIVSMNGATRDVLGEIRPRATGLDICLGVGEPGGLDRLPVSWEQARESLALRSMVGSGHFQAVFFKELGVLHLLGQIPTDEVLGSALFHKFNDALAHGGTPSDIKVLEAYLEEGTLRRTAARVFLHHTTVEHRLKRIEDRLGLDLSQPQTRFQAQVLLKLHRMIRLRDASRI